MLAVCHQFKQEEDGWDCLRVYNSVTLQEIVCFKENLGVVRQIMWKDYD